MPREGASSIHPKSPLLRRWSEKLEQACLVQTLLGALHERKGKEGVKKAKKKKGDASDAKSLEDIRAAGGAKKTQEGEGYCGQLEDSQARYLGRGIEKGVNYFSRLTVLCTNRLLSPLKLWLRF